MNSPLPPPCRRAAAYAPQRTCAGTGTKHPQAGLLRFVNVKGVPTPDFLLGPHRAPGRGVYVLPTEEALKSAIKRKTFAHKLKTNKPPVPWEEIARHLPETRIPAPEPRVDLDICLK